MRLSDPTPRDMPGPGDEETWPEPSGHPHDPRDEYEEPDDPEEYR